ncbi:MAG: flagellar basal-body rod protein FlgG [Planctomycetes bacterium]|nr:flagellar basal-body rod protein FlgG [Planctomycetota bacterium]
MLTGFKTATTALDAFQTSLENSSNNLANLNTTGYKRSGIDFQDLFSTGADNVQVGRGVRVVDGPRDFKQGAPNITNRELDVAIEGRGFFVVQFPDGRIQYTRDGSFRNDALGRLVTERGNVVQPPITFPADVTSTTIDANGVVSVLTKSSPRVPVVIGQFQLARFTNPQGLRADGDNLFIETTASGPPTIVLPGSSGIGSLRQGSLESSNVDVSNELAHLVVAQRAYGVNSRVLRATDQMISSALSTIQ